MNALATMVILFFAIGFIVWVFFRAGQSIPKVGYFLALTFFMVVLGIWGLIAIEDFDETDEGLGVALAFAGSLLLLATAVGLVAGAMDDVAPVVGFAAGLAISCAIHFWLVPHASPWVGVSLTLGCCITGVVVGTLQKKENSDAVNIYLR